MLIFVAASAFEHTGLCVWMGGSLCFLGEKHVFLVFKVVIYT